jgi:hypothetical protein
VNRHPHSHGCTRGHLQKGEEEIRNSTDIGSFSNPDAAVYLNKKENSGLRKIFRLIKTSKDKQKMRLLDEP